MYLKKLETARLVKSEMGISESGKAMKFYSLENFGIEVTKELLEELSKNIAIQNPEEQTKAGCE